MRTIRADEFEDCRVTGDDFRRALTRAVMRYLDTPAGWRMNGEYGGEFGGFFPVQVRITPPHTTFHFTLCSPRDVSPFWLMMLTTASGSPFAVVKTLNTFCPASINGALKLTVLLDEDEYSVTSIISILRGEVAHEG